MNIDNPHFCQPDWPVANVLAFNTTRQHPHRDKPPVTDFDSFNLGTHVGDDIGRVENNRQALKEFLPKGSQIQWLEQVHGNTVVEVHCHSEQPLVADAAVTRNPDVTLAVMTADCLPILLSCGQGKEVAVIHGGWRPLLAGIISNTLQKMQSRNTELYAWLGPCIGEQAFEVGAEVRQAFVGQSAMFDAAFKSTGQGKYLGNLALIAKLQLNSVGVQQVSAVNHCTYAMEQRYYSYRRNAITGRMAAFITRL
ncbi:peptidoglycan editing factor PgeF [Thalassomonas actiniarum]|uniref:Purine nucleoside phosphorylase n=1 Tax=Thalassomonas actiniarum TaxID=485447 RepID=A0AAE9YMI2_9GAMM|nr:peptidoglycan editing factor PgeF [Thalassomonas actiniarum]WDD97955.1 peptidoglycan editing factor PgeF [Thalassomonas actiniarum]